MLSTLNQCSLFDFNNDTTTLLDESPIDNFELNILQQFSTSVEHYKKVEIQPEVASLLLKYRNPKNRSLDKTRIDRYVADINAKKWHFTGDPIRFDTDGNIIDGQHRLSAVVQSNIPIKFLVITGLDPVCIEGIDTHKPRTGKDTLQLFSDLGNKDSGILSAAIKKIIAYETRLSLAGGSPIQKLTTNAAIRKFYNTHEVRLRESLYFVKDTATNGSLLLAKADFVFLYYIFSSIDQKDAINFMTKLITGADVPMKSNIYMLIQIILKSRNSPSAKLPLQNMLFTAIKAWNKDRKNRSYTTESSLKYYTGDKYPIAI